MDKIDPKSPWRVHNRLYFLWERRKAILSTINCSPRYTKAYSTAYNSNKVSKAISCTLRALDYKYTGWEWDTMQHVLLRLHMFSTRRKGVGEQQFINNINESFWWGAFKEPIKIFYPALRKDLEFRTKYVERKHTNMLAPKANEKCCPHVSRLWRIELSAEQRSSQLSGPLCQVPNTCGHEVLSWNTKCSTEAWSKIVVWNRQAQAIGSQPSTLQLSC